MSAASNFRTNFHRWSVDYTRRAEHFNTLKMGAIFVGIPGCATVAACHFNLTSLQKQFQGKMC